MSEIPSQESFEQAYDEMGLADAPEEVLNDDGVAYQQFQRANQIEQQGGSTPPTQA